MTNSKDIVISRCLVVSNASSTFVTSRKHTEQERKKGEESRASRKKITMKLMIYALKIMHLLFGTIFLNQVLSVHNRHYAKSSIKMVVSMVTV